jgi:hypothetical protein
VYHDLDTWRRYVSAAGFVELNYYYCPIGLPREKQPWLASVLASERLASVRTRGRFRLTFRYRDQVFRLIVTTVGEVVSDDSS